jgi:hypothetical protein
MFMTLHHRSGRKRAIPVNDSPPPKDHAFGAKQPVPLCQAIAFSHVVVARRHSHQLDPCLGEPVAKTRQSRLALAFLDEVAGHRQAADLVPS